MYTATITSQNQITIPAKFAKELFGGKVKKVLITKLKDGLFVRPDPDPRNFVGKLRLGRKFKSVEDMVKFNEGALDEIFSR